MKILAILQYVVACAAWAVLPVVGASQAASPKARPDVTAGRSAEESTNEPMAVDVPFMHGRHHEAAAMSAAQLSSMSSAAPPTATVAADGTTGSVEGLAIPPGYHIQSFTTSGESQPAAAGAISETSQPVGTAAIEQQIPTSAMDGSTGNADGLQIPPGYHIQSVSSSESQSAVADPAAGASQSPSVPIPGQPSRVSAADGSTGNVDGMQIPPGYHIQSFATAGQSQPETAGTVGHMPQPADASTIGQSPLASATDGNAVHADGMQIPPGYHIQSFASGQAQPTSAGVAAEAPVSTAASGQPSPSSAADGIPGDTNGLEMPPGYSMQSFASDMSQPEAAGAVGVASQSSEGANMRQATSSAESSKMENVDGMQIPAGYHIQAVTSGASSGKGQSDQSVQVDDSSNSVQAAGMTIPPGYQVQSTSTGNVDDLQIPPNYQIQSTGSVDGLAIPPGYQMQSLANTVPDLSASSAKSLPQNAEAETEQVQADSSKSVTADTDSNAEPITQDTKTSSNDGPDGWEVSNMGGNEEEEAGRPAEASVSTEAKSMVAQKSPPGSTTVVSSSEQPVEANQDGSGAATPGMLEASEDVSVPSVQVTPEEGPVDQVLSYASGKQQEQDAPMAAVPPQRLGAIASVECLTEELNSGQPCKSNNVEQKAATKIPEVPAKPALRKPLLTSGHAHSERSITEVAAGPSTRAREAHTHLRRHRPHRVVKEVRHQKEPEPDSDFQEVEHVHLAHHQHGEKAHLAPVVQLHTMADLVSEQEP